MNRLSALLVVLALGLAVPPLATAQLGPNNVPAPLTVPDSELAAPEAFEEDEGLTTRQLVLIFGGAAGVLALIAWFIMRDARSAAPVADRRQAAAAPGTSVPKTKSAREREREQARKRAKAKAVRDQRKRNRPR